MLEVRVVVLEFALVVGLLCIGGIVLDGALRLLRHRRRRRNTRGAAAAVVIDRDGTVLGSYLDPFGHPWRSARVHGPESAWKPAEPWRPHAYAWEGFGTTEEEAFAAANRLRRRHLQLFGLMHPDIDGERPAWMAAPPAS
jgi:hypothetical protein